MRKRNRNDIGLNRKKIIIVICHFLTLYSTALLRMNNGGNLGFPSPISNSSSSTPNNSSSIPMSNNNSNFSISKNNNNDSTSIAGGQTVINGSSHISVSDFILLPILSLTIILAIAYIILVLIRPTFRNNKSNWFTINVCLTIALLSTILLQMNIMQIMNLSSSESCRAKTFSSVMAACQMMYSHAVIAINRFLTVVYSNKRFFRSIRCIWGFIGFGWLIAFLISLPNLFANGFACSNSTPPAFLPYYTLIGILIIPVMIVLMCNIQIFLFVYRSSQRVHAENRGNKVSQVRDVRLIKTMIITFTVFVVGWTPLFVEQTFSASITVSSAVDTIFQILPSVSMLCDVILLIYTNQPVRLFLWQSIVRRRQIVPVNALANTAKTNAHIIQKH